MANETRIFRIPPNMPVQAVASHVDHYLRANQGLQVQGASNGEECVLQCQVRKRMAGKRYQACALRRLYRSHVQRRIT